MGVLRRIVPLLLAGLLALAPASALAQGGAGDDQYQDPFGGSNDTPAQSGGGSSSGGSQSGSSQGSQGGSSSQGGGTSSSGQSSGSSGATEAPAQTSAPATSPAPVDPGTAPTAAPAASGQLPRTGLDVRLVALLGAGLLAAGVGLRLRLRPVEAPPRAGRAVDGRGR